MSFSQEAHIMQYFKYDHLPERLQGISKPFAELAAKIHKHPVSNQESVMCLRKLLEAKDCAVRATLDEYAQPPETQSL
jgi:hypothetical protein